MFDFRSPLIIQSVTDESLNKNFNLLKNDIIESVNGVKTPYADEIESILSKNKNQTIEVSILREGMSLSKTLNVDENGKLGILFGASPADLIDNGYIELVTETYSLSESISVGATTFSATVSSYLGQFKAIFSPETGAYKGLGGFIAIVN